jgi:hypothetical protein
VVSKLFALFPQLEKQVRSHSFSTKIENTMNIKSFTAIVYKEEDMYVAECPEVGTVDQGETIEEALANLKEATKLYL